MGTTTRIRLPELPDERGAEGAAPAEKSTRPLCSGLVLLIEDEPSVRSVTQRVLQRAGFTVIAAENGREGVALFEQYAEDILLVLSDMIMPELSGPEVAPSVRALRPNVPLLFMSGYTEESVLKRGLASGVLHLLQKPFTPDALVAKVCEVVELVAAGARAGAGSVR